MRTFATREFARAAAKPIESGCVKRIVIYNPGGPDALEVVDSPTPKPGSGEVLVRAQAIGVGRPDVLVRRGTYRWMPPLPATPGNEMAGIIEAAGPGVPENIVGRRVLVSSRELKQRGGCYAEAIAVPAAAVRELPDSISFETAVCLPNFQLAWALLYNTGVQPPSSVVIVGAAGGVGSALVQLAKHAGITVIGTVSSPEKAAFVRSLGADHTIDYRTEAVDARILELTQGRGVDLILDHIGGPAFAGHLAALARFGTLVSFSTFGGLPDESLFSQLLENSARCVGVRCFSIHAYDHDPDGRRALLDHAIDVVKSGAIAPPIAARLALAQARRAHELLEGGSALGKIILVP